MPIIKFVNESEKIEYPTEQDVCSLLCYAFAPQKTIMEVLGIEYDECPDY